MIGLFRKGLVCSLVALFVFSSLSLNISGSFKDVDQKKYFEPISVDPGDDVSIACYSFGRSGMRKHEVVLSYDDADLIFEKFEELKYKITHRPFNEETQELKLEFIDLLEENCVIPSGLYEDDLISLLNPRWFKRLLNKQDFSGRKSIFGMANGGSATAFLCSIASGGLGWVFPPLMIPRPRFATAWYGYGMTETSISELYTLRGFFAVGQHLGLSAGFVGMGLAFAFPGVQPIYGLIGYAFIAGVFGPADIYWYPLNSPPVISEEDPVDGSEGVPLSLSELSFRISDDDGDLMSYSVTTSPDVGSGSGNLKPDGTYSVSISGLQGLIQYTWNVEVSDGKDTSVSSFSFLTEAAGPIVSNPSPENGATDVSVNLSQLSFHLKDLQGDLMDYTVETSPDIGSGSSSGVGDGTYTVDVSNLDYFTEYTWYVNVTDGTYWAKKTFSFITEIKMVFDPFVEGWQYRKQITIDHTKVVGDLENFPVLISTIDSDLRDKAQDDGDDILFMDGTGVAEKLYHEIEHYDDSSGELIAWVNIPSLSSTVDTSFYMYYGNSGCTNQQTSEMVWDSHYKGVWHMNDKTTSTIKDSTSNSNTGDKYDVNEPIEANGKIGKCQDFDGSDDVIDCGTKSNLDNTGYITFELWVKFDNLPTSSEPDYFTIVRKDYGYMMALLYNSDLRIMYWDGSTRYNGESSFSSSITTDIWYYLGGTFDTGTNNIEFFKDGVKDSCTEWTISQSNNNGYDLDIGGMQGYSECTVDGRIDEFRISNIVRSDDWISTGYNNQIHLESFMSVGEQEEVPNRAPEAPIINGQTSGTAGQSYSYTFVSVDPDADDVFYQVDWGDGNVDPWDGPYESNEIISKDHVWSEQGEFTIKARAKDVNEEIGEWGTLEVTMPMNQQSQNWWFLQNHPRMFPILRHMLGM